jgi:hypothetical protein
VQRDWALRGYVSSDNASSRPARHHESGAGSDSVTSSWIVAAISAGWSGVNSSSTIEGFWRKPLCRGRAFASPGNNDGSMKRLILPWAAFAVVLCFALPASAANGRSVKGVITALSGDAVSVRSASSIVTTCGVTHASPDLDDFAAGDRVQVVCRGRHGARFVLTRIRHLDAPAPATPSNETEPVKFGGAITALSDTSISLHDGDRDLTCSITSSSPSTADYKIGQHVRVACVGGKLAAIAAVTSDVGRYFVGTLSALDAKSITVQTPAGPVKCSIGDGSPSTAGFQVGDHVGMGCRASTMQLVLLKRVDGDGTSSPPPPAPPTPTTVGARGTVSAISDSSVSVQTDGGTVTCERGPLSPSLGDAKVGDRVAMKCVGAVVVGFEKVT